MLWQVVKATNFESFDVSSHVMTSHINLSYSNFNSFEFKLDLQWRLQNHGGRAGPLLLCKFHGNLTSTIYFAERDEC